MSENKSTEVRRGGPGFGRMGHGPAEKAKDFKKSGTRLLMEFKSYKLHLIFVLITSVMAVLFNTFGPKILGEAIDVLSQGLFSKNINFQRIKEILLLLASLYAFSAFFSFLQEYIMAGVSQTIIKKLRKELSEKINKLPLKYFDDNSVGDILSRVTNDTETIGNTLQRGATQILTTTVTIIGIIVIMLTISPLMTLITILTLPLSGFSIRFLMKFSQVFFKDQQKKLGTLNGHIEEMYSGHLIVKAYNREDLSIEKFESINISLTNTVRDAQFYSGLIMPVNQLISNLVYVLISITGAILVIDGKISIGNIQAFLQYNRQFSHPIAHLSQIINQLQSAVAAAERIYEVLDEKEEINDSEDAVELKNIAGDIKFNHVRFGYSSNKILLQDMNIDACEGQTVAIVGPTGAGKTTLVNLLMRFYEIDAGEITVDGVNIKNIKRNSLRKNIGMVLQDTWLFNGTIRENILYGKENATEEEIIIASKLAQAHHFIQTISDGYDTIINEEGSNLSAGQKQLLTIARAFLSDPSILILDEATSSIDTRTEIQIQEALSRLMYGRTSFVIAHRLSTIKNADLILVMNNGDVVEKGNHAQLLEQNGFYAELYNSQFNM